MDPDQVGNKHEQEECAADEAQEQGETKEQQPSLPAQQSPSASGSEPNTTEQSSEVSTSDVESKSVETTESGSTDTNLDNRAKHPAPVAQSLEQLACLRVKELLTTGTAEQVRIHSTATRVWECVCVYLSCGTWRDSDRAVGMC